MSSITSIFSIIIALPIFLLSTYTAFKTQQRNVDPTGIWNCIDSQGNKIPNCDIPVITFSPTPTKVGADAGSINFKTVARDTGDGTVKEKKEYVITTQDQFQTLWNTFYVGSVKAPEISFKDEMVLVVTLGEVASGGYDIEIMNIKEERDVIKVSVFEVKPGEGCMTTQALTSPFHFVKMPATTKKIEFVRLQQTRNC